MSRGQLSLSLSRISPVTLSAQEVIPCEVLATPQWAAGINGVSGDVFKTKGYHSKKWSWVWLYIISRENPDMRKSNSQLQLTSCFQPCSLLPEDLPRLSNLSVPPFMSGSLWLPSMVEGGVWSRSWRVGLEFPHPPPKAALWLHIR